MWWWRSGRGRWLRSGPGRCWTPSGSNLICVRIVIRLLIIKLLGFYPIDSYPSLLLYIVLSLLYYQFNSFLGFSISLYGIRARSYKETILIPAWKQAMDEEVDALISRRTWELISAPKHVVFCRWVYTLTYRPDSSVDRYKARLIAKGYTQTYGVDYFETFSPVARLNAIRIMFSIVVNMEWPLFQLDIKNAFLYGDLKE